jgi:uncharacterized protein (TIGR01440 family)
MFNKIEQQARQALLELLETAQPEVGDIIVIGCSSSEIAGGDIGKAPSSEMAAAVVSGVMPILRERGLYLAAQCCEHLNRALIIERTAAKSFGYEIVSVRPRPQAGGSFATAVWENMEQPVAVEHVRAVAGLDIGLTLIGMHLKEVAVPVRLEVKMIGAAHVVAARTRPRLIGGERAEYE